MDAHERYRAAFSLVPARCLDRLGMTNALLDKCLDSAAATGHATRQMVRYGLHPGICAP
jgi:hypothetical protein